MFQKQPVLMSVCLTSFGARGIKTKLCKFTCLKQTILEVSHQVQRLRLGLELGIEFS